MAEVMKFEDFKEHGSENAAKVGTSRCEHYIRVENSVLQNDENSLFLAHGYLHLFC